MTLSQGLRKSIQDSDHETCKNHCFSILQWGGILPKNDKRIIGLGNDICNYLKKVQDRLTNDMSSNEYYNDEMIMNSGFTKIYSLCIDDFIIYDGRVGAALGFLVRKFCEDCTLEKVPNELAFAWGKGKESTYKSSSMNKRNPSKENYVFPELMNNPKRHTENNIRANWLLREIADKTDSKFNKLEKALQMRAIEASLFMIRSIKQETQEHNAQRQTKRQRINEMTEFLDMQSGIIAEYDDKLTRQLIEQITVFDDRLLVSFKSGVDIEVEI